MGWSNWLVSYIFFGIFNLFWLSEAQGNLFFQTMHVCTFSDKKFEIAVNIRLGQSIDLMTPLHLICQARLYLKEIIYQYARQELNGTIDTHHLCTAFQDWFDDTILVVSSSDFSAILADVTDTLPWSLLTSRTLRLWLVLDILPIQGILKWYTRKYLSWPTAVRANFFSSCA